MFHIWLFIYSPFTGHPHTLIREANIPPLYEKELFVLDNLDNTVLCDSAFPPMPEQPQVVAMAYVPWQHFTQMYENLERGYKAGTIFPELDKPFTGRRCVK